MHLGSRARISIALVATVLVASTALADGVFQGGTEGNDVLNGTPTADSIYGRGGNDTISGLAGDDELDGGSGADSFAGGDGSDVVSYSGTAPVTVTIDGVANDGAAGENDNVGPDVEDIYGAAGDDKLTGSAAANTIDGGPGGDRITGGPGTDALFAGEGDDVIDARDGEIDRIECGPGNDTVTVDEVDIVAADCEVVSKPEITMTPQLTLIKSKNRLIISAIAKNTRLRIVCVSKCKGGPVVVSRKKVKLDGQDTFRTKIPRGIAGRTIEIGATAPGERTTCVRKKITKQYLVRKSKKPCTTVAKGP